MDCPHCQKPLPEAAAFCPTCGGRLQQLAPPPPPPASEAAPPRPQGEWWAKQVPYRNPPALSSYYVGLFSIIPCVGLLLAVVAIPLGIIGLLRARQHPESYGRAHAWSGIALALLSLGIHTGLYLWLQFGK